MNADNISGIILSAGLSGRMNHFKPMLKLDNGKTFIQSITEKLFKICEEVIIVTGFCSEEIIEHVNSVCDVDRISFVLNKDYKKGMFSSLQTGLKKSNSDWYLYHFVDQPSLPDKFYFNFIKQIDNKANWIQPICGNRKGHPVIFDESVKERILDSDINKSLRDIGGDKSIKKNFWECGTELIFQDIDTEKEFSDLFNR